MSAWSGLDRHAEVERDERVCEALASVELDKLAIDGHPWTPLGSHLERLVRSAARRPVVLERRQRVAKPEHADHRRAPDLGVREVEFKERVRLEDCLEVDEVRGDFKERVGERADVGGSKEVLDRL